VEYRRFFITGLPRSGTTWLKNMLNEITGVMCFGEGLLYSGIAREVPSLFDSVAGGIREWVEFIAQRKGSVLNTDQAIRTIGNRVNVIGEAIVEGETERLTMLMVHAAVEYLFSEWDVAGEKSPVIRGSDLHRIAHCNRNALIVVLTRDVCDWIVSWSRLYYQRRSLVAVSWQYPPFTNGDFIQLDRTFGKGMPERFLNEATMRKLVAIWKDVVRAAEELAAVRRNVLHFRYEDLYAGPAAILNEVLPFLCDADSEQIERAVQETASGAGEASKPHDNGKLLARADIELISELVGGGHALAS